jgi:hypothetical protein
VVTPGGLYIPTGTVPTLQFFSGFGGTDFSVTAPVVTGTLAQSTTTVQVTFPPGFTSAAYYAKR